MNPIYVIPDLNSSRNLETLKQIHASVIASTGNEQPFPISSKLASLYIGYNDLGSFVSVLKAIKETETFLWNSMIKDNLNSGLIEPAFLVFKVMREKAISCDGYTFPALNELALLLDFDRSFSEMIHCVAVRMGFESDVYFCNTMIKAYVKMGGFGGALKLFEEMPVRDLVSWTSMISGYAYEENVKGAVRLFNEMRKELRPNEVSMIVMLQACSDVVQGRQLHGFVIKNGFSNDQSLGNAFLKMYADFGCLGDSETLFKESNVRDIISWNTMISLYSLEANTMMMLNCFNMMRYEVDPSIKTLTLLISGLAESGNSYEEGRQVHCLVLKYGFSDDILSSSLSNLYAKSVDLEALTNLFREASRYNNSSLGAMICGMIATGNFEWAIEIFQQMLAAGVQPVSENITSIVIACTSLGALRYGKAIHCYSIRNFLLDSNEEARSLETSILNMYIRCGNIYSARICFDRIQVKDLVTWTSMIEGYGTHGLGSQALELFHRMGDEGLEPNSITFLSLLSACSHSGLLHEGCEILNSMKWVFGIEPDLGHYTCTIDLLGRFGKLKEALTIILKLVAIPDSRIWAAVLSAARLHEDRKIGEFAAQKVLDLESDNAGYYTLFSNVQAIAQKWDEAAEVRNAMKGRNLIKYPGWSCLEVGGNFHGFVSGDRSHSKIDEVNRMTEILCRNAVEIGNIFYN